MTETTMPQSTPVQAEAKKNIDPTAVAVKVEEILKAIKPDIIGLMAAGDKPSYLADLAEKFYVEHIEPLDIPGPDTLIDPLVRQAIKPVVTALWAAVAAKLAKADVVKSEGTADAS